MAKVNVDCAEILEEVEISVVNLLKGHKVARARVLPALRVIEIRCNGGAGET